MTLVEPNPIAIRDIATVYAVASAAPVPPLVIESRFEDYEPEELFDVVVCENWLGSSEHERRLLGKLGQMVAGRGILLVTAVSPVGMLPNLLRRALATPARRSRIALRRADVGVVPRVRPAPADAGRHDPGRH